jgi:predicted porin
MNKSSLLALAIAGTLAAPAVLAEVYVSARMGVDMNTSDIDADETTTFGNLSSRLGWKGETDLGNGLTAFGKLEVAADGFGVRDLHVGLAGDFGKIIIAEKVYTAFYNHVTGPLDPTYWVGGGTFIETGRTDNVIAYQGGNDMFSFEVAAEADGTDVTEPGGNADGITGYQAGASIGLGDNWTIGAAVRNAEDSIDNATDEDVIGATLYGNLGDIYLAGMFQSSDVLDSAAILAQIGGFFVTYETVDLDGAADLANIAAGYSASIGENTSWWIEAVSKDGDDVVADSEEIVAALRFDF